MQAVIQAVVARLTADATLASQSASGTGQTSTAVYLSRAPEGAAFPFVILEASNAAPTEHDFPGARITHIRIALVCVAASLQTAMAMAQRIVVLLDQTPLNLTSGILLDAAELHSPQPLLAGASSAGGEIYRVATRFVFSVFTTLGS